MSIYGPNPQAALDTFEARPLVLVIIGDDGCERVWLSNDIETAEHHEWAARHIEAAAGIARRMQDGTGSA